MTAALQLGAGANAASWDVDLYDFNAVDNNWVNVGSLSSGKAVVPRFFSLLRFFLPNFTVKRILGAYTTVLVRCRSVYIYIYVR